MLNGRIKLLRILHGLTQKEMAELLHKSQSTYCRLEKGVLAITSEDIQNIARIFDCGPEELFSGQNAAQIYQGIQKDVTENGAAREALLLETYHEEIMRCIAEHQRQLQEQIGQQAKDAQMQMIRMFQEIIAGLKAP